MLYLGYDDSTKENDICLLVLDKDVFFNEYVQPILIPSQGANIPVNTMCVISGLGRLYEGKINYSCLLIKSLNFLKYYLNNKYIYS